MTWMVGNTTEDDHVVILTDSLSLVSKLQRGLIKKDWFLLLRHIPARMEVIYVPGHAGIRYNEKADWLAGKALPFGNLEPTAADIADAISRGIQEREERDESTWSMARLREKETARGEGVNVPLRGDRRLIATQIRTGCMTKRGLRILLDMLEGRGPVYHPVPLLF